MKFTVNWLKQYIDFDLTPAELADRLTMAGLEVDSVEPLYVGAEGIKVARILDVQPHPNADKLVLCRAEAGGDEFQVVCGAPNARTGMLTAVAQPGHQFPNDFKIKKSKIRGEISEGMFCSAKELGISEDHSGIIDLPENFNPGDFLTEALALNDTAIEIDLTPNRPDCASVLGVAREVGAFVSTKMKPPVAKAPDLSGDDMPFNITVRDEKTCPRYCGKMLTDVKIGPSPWWLQRILLAVGLRPINNVVDITNFVMLEYGQPLHAFDFKKLSGSEIIVRKASQKEMVTTLDGVAHELDSEMLVIADADKPVAVAGVMGAENTEVSEDTSEILLESAYFDPVSVRRTARQLNLATDSSYRFERGVDINGVPKALARAVELMKEIAGAREVAGGVDRYNKVYEPQQLILRPGRVGSLLGREFNAGELAELLESIELPVDISADGHLNVSIPSFRVDLEREVDLVEEVARLVGYNNLPSQLPQAPMRFPQSDADRALVKQVSDIMTSIGFHEAINYSFANEKHFDMLGLDNDNPKRRVVRLLNPLAEDQNVMRTEILPGLLENLKRNINYQKTDVRLFETGKTFTPTDAEQPQEQIRLCAVISGRRHPDAPVIHFNQEKADLFDIKGAVGHIIDELRLEGISFDSKAEAPGYIEPGMHAAIASASEALGFIGKIGSGCLKSFGIKQEVYVLDLNLSKVLTQQTRPVIFSELPKYPAVKWDLAVIVPESVAGGDMIKAILDQDELLIEDAELFDIFRGKNIPEGFKSVALSITYRDMTQTLDDETVGKIHKRMIDMILSDFKGQLREA